MKCLLPFLLFSVSAFSEIIPSARLTTWQGNVGVSNGIPSDSWPIGTVVFAGESAARVQDALDTNANNRVVLLAATNAAGAGGIHAHAGTTLAINRNSIALRIAANAHVSSSANFWVNMQNSSTPFASSGWGTVHLITGGNTAGSSSLTVAATTGLAQGQMCWIEVTNVPGVLPYGDGGGGAPAQFDNDRLRDGSAVMHTIHLVTGISGNTVTIDPPLAFQYPGTPRISGFQTDARQWVGVESDGGTIGHTGYKLISMFGVFNCWLSGLNVTNYGNSTTGSRCVTPTTVARWEIRRCYFANSTGAHDVGYCIDTSGVNHGLIEDNIFYKLQGSIFLQGSSANVIAYNTVFHTYNQDSGVDWLAGGFVANHSPYPMHNLIEGNYVPMIQPDFYYGGSRYGTLLRNYVPGSDVLTEQHRRTISIDSRQWDYSVVGNILGTTNMPSTVRLEKPNITLTVTEAGAIAWLPGWTNNNDIGWVNNYVARLGFPGIGSDGSDGTADPPAPDDTQLGHIDLSVRTNTSLATHYTLWHGNYDGFSKAQVWDTSIADHAIPSTYYLGGKPAYFGALTWPPYNPALPPTDITNALARIPSGYRLLYNRNPPMGATLNVTTLNAGSLIQTP